MCISQISHTCDLCPGFCAGKLVIYVVACRIFRFLPVQKDRCGRSRPRGCDPCLPRNYRSCSGTVFPPRPVMEPELQPSLPSEVPEEALKCFGKSCVLRVVLFSFINLPFLSVCCRLKGSPFSCQYAARFFFRQIPGYCLLLCAARQEIAIVPCYHTCLAK